MENKAFIVGKCVLIFLSTIIVWHLYRFIVSFSAYKSFFEWETGQGYLFYLFFYIIMLAILFFFTIHVDHSSLRDLGIRRVAKWKYHILLGVVFAFLIRFLQTGSGLLIGGVVVVHNYRSPFVIVFFIVTTFFVGLSEEGIFRGYIQRRLTEVLKFLPALLVTTILFHIYHINFFTASTGELVTAVLGIAPNFAIFAGYLYYKSRGILLAPIALHMFYDLFGTIVPIGIDITNIEPILVSISNILIWSVLIIVLKIMADRARILTQT